MSTVTLHTTHLASNGYVTPNRSQDPKNAVHATLMQDLSSACPASIVDSSIPLNLESNQITKTRFHPEKFADRCMLRVVKSPRPSHTPALSLSPQRPRTTIPTIAQPTTSTEDLQALLTNIQQAAKSYDPNADPVTDTIQRAAIRSAAKDLLFSMTTPDEMSWQKLTNLSEASTLRTAMSLGILKAIPTSGSISRDELARKVNVTENLIERMLRILVGTGMLDQTEVASGLGDYKHTKFSREFSDITIPQPGTFFYATYDVIHRPMVDFDKYLRDNARDGIFTEPKSNYANPFVSLYGEPGESVWDAIVRYAEMTRTFQISMATLHRFVPPVGPFYDFSQFKATGPDDERIQIIDVGGGNGGVIRGIVAATPELDAGKCVLQDVEDVIALAEDTKAAGIQTQVIDFNKGQPVKGARAYYMRFISHDYSDDDLVNILSHISEAMAADSKLLIADHVLPDRLDEVSMMAGAMDQMMLAIGGTERTERRFSEVLAKAGMRLNKVCYIPGGTAAIVEGVKM